MGNKNNKFISVEANPKLINNLINSGKINEYNVQFINAAISYEASMVNFAIDERNLGSRVTNSSEHTILVNSTTLNQIIQTYNIGKYCLISDIEGSEIEILFGEKDSYVILNCIQIIIELHDIDYKGHFYRKEEIANLYMTKFNMNKIFSDGNIWVLNRN